MKIIFAFCAAWVFPLLVCGEETDSNWSRIETKIQANAERMVDACVSVRAQSGAWGSGVLVNSSGLIFSAAHVYRVPGETVTVFLSRDRRAEATVLKMDQSHDVAVLQLLEAPAGIKPAPLCRTPKLSQGSTFVAAGHASGFDAERPSPLRVGFGFYALNKGKIYSTCRITAGDSGGPLYNETGVVQAIHHTMDGKGKYSAHIPVYRFFELWPELEKAVTRP